MSAPSPRPVSRRDSDPQELTEKATEAGTEETPDPGKGRRTTIITAVCFLVGLVLLVALNMR